MKSIFLPNAGQKLVGSGPGGALEEEPPTKKNIGLSKKFEVRREHLNFHFQQKLEYEKIRLISANTGSN